MAKFYMEDGSIKSGDQIMHEMRMLKTELNKHDIPILKKPCGDKNYRRIGNICIYDFLVHLSDYLKIYNECIINIITGESHECHNNGCHECIQKWLNDSKW